MAHVELRFSNGESVSVFNGEMVFLRKRGYSNTQYKIVALSVSQEKERLMYHMAAQQVGKKFNTWGLRRALLPWPLYRSTDGLSQNGSWFCSELVTCLLQRGGMLPNVLAAQSSPNTLYTLTQSSVSGNGIEQGLRTSLAANQLALREKTEELQWGGLRGTPARAPSESAATPKKPVLPLRSAWVSQVAVQSAARTNIKISPAKRGSSWASAMQLP